MAIRMIAIESGKRHEENLGRSQRPEPITRSAAGEWHEAKIPEGPKELGKLARREPPGFKAGNLFKSPMENQRAKMERLRICDF
jgi:hypothetical protein